MGLGGRLEEDLWILNVPKGVLRCMDICLSRERTGLALQVVFCFFFFLFKLRDCSTWHSAINR